MLIATNAGGKSDTCYFSVTTVDNLEPVITAAAANNGSITAGTAAGKCSLVAGKQFDITAVDNCSPVLTYSYTLTYGGATSSPVNSSTLQGVTFAKGATTVNWNVSDVNGNIATYSYNVIIADQEKPVISNLAVTPPVLILPNNQMRNVTLYYNTSDNCGAVTTSVTVTSNDPNATNDWEVTDARHVKLRAVRSNAGQYRVYTITVTATDAAGNTSTQQVQVYVLQFIYGLGELVPGTIDVQARPNPSPNHFTLTMKSKLGIPMNIRVYNISGRIIENRNNVAANSTVTLGANYTAGVYFVEVTQGIGKQVITLIKM
jgi:hypothetical protein